MGNEHDVFAGDDVTVTNQTPDTVASDFATIQFVVNQMMIGMATATLVKVLSCTNTGGVARAGTVDLTILVDMISEDGQTFPHGTIFKAPYQRMQGGVNAIILDPSPGDIGVCVFAMRDISAVQADPDAARNRSPSAGAPPGSRRIFSLSDALYLGGMLNDVPTRYVRFHSDGLELVSPNAVRISAPTINLEASTEINMQAPTININGNIVQDGDISSTGSIEADVEVTAAGIDLSSHAHSGVTPGGSNTGPPV